MSNIFVYTAIGLAVLSVWNWRREAEPFLIEIRTFQNACAPQDHVRNGLRFVVALPKLFPLALDIAITFLLVANLGLTGGVVGATVALAMSNTIAYFIRREMKHFKSLSKINTVKQKPIQEKTL